MRGRFSSPRVKAREILKSLDIRHQREIEIEEIAYTRGLIVYEGALEGAEGRLLHGTEKGIARIRANIPEIGKKRFTIAHELGHFELHRDSGPIRLCEDKHLLLYRETRPGESEANEFAAELLMPEDLFQFLCKSGTPSFDIISNLADQFRTSLTATAIRYVEYSPHRCALVVSQDRKVKWYRANEDFGYHIKVGLQLSQNTVAVDFFNGKELPQQMETILADSWLDGRTLDQDAMIKEQSIPISRYNTVLSLLWIDVDFDELSPYEEEKPRYDPDYFTPDGKRWRW